MGNCKRWPISEARSRDPITIEVDDSHKASSLDEALRTSCSSAAERVLSLVLPTQSERVPAPRPEPESAGRTVVAAPCQGATHRVLGRDGGGLG
jgi:hypothetical protein